MSESHRPGTRGQEHLIEIDAPVEAVWRAITEAEEVTRWYVQEARIDPRVGGTYEVSWGEGMDGASEIMAFEPGRRLRIQHRPTPGSPEMPTGPMVEEYLLETRGGATVLRLVTSGIPDSEDWDWFYEGTKRGWTIFLMTLRHYLERHRGVPRDHFVTMVGIPGSCEEAWPKLMGPDGLGLADLPESVGPDTTYRGRTGFDQELEGRILLLDPPYRLLATVTGLNDAVLGATLERMGPSNFLYLSLSMFGLGEAETERIRTRWGAWASALFPDAGSPADAFRDMFDGGAATAPGGHDA
jgi:uncharacterized protein YndB with AHSA1/START domain